MKPEDCHSEVTLFELTNDFPHLHLPCTEPQRAVVPGAKNKGAKAF